MASSDPVRLYRALVPLQRIRRYAQHAAVTPQSVAEHSYYVALLATAYADQLLDRRVEVSRMAVMELALWHDAGEAICGDTPHPVKRANAILHDALDAVEERALVLLTRYAGARVEARVSHRVDSYPLENLLVKLADWVELMLYVHEEARCGNATLRPAFEAVWAQIQNGLQAQFVARGSIVAEWYREVLEDLKTVDDPTRADWDDAFGRGLTP